MRGVEINTGDSVSLLPSERLNMISNKHKTLPLAPPLQRKLTDFNDVPFQEDVFRLQISVEDTPADGGTRVNKHRGTVQSDAAIGALAFAHWETIMLQGC